MAIGNVFDRASTARVSIWSGSALTLIGDVHRLTGFSLDIGLSRMTWVLDPMVGGMG